ncbi:MAG TPA: response regulator [Acidobacteriota bacterium]|nr:response regulator [Acidobacteriota bacterium]
MALILLVDDDEAFRKAQHLSLTRAGFEVIDARDGDEAERLFAQNWPDLVLTDIIMPGKEGIATIQCLRRMNESVPIIAMSGGGRMHAEDCLVLAKYLGAACTLTKPFTNRELLTTINEVLAVS